MKLSEMRKAIAPAVLTVLGVIAQWIATSGLDEAELRTALAGLFMAVVVYLIPNAQPTRPTETIIRP